MATLSLSVTVPDARAASILADFCTYHGYRETLESGQPNPLTKAQFAKSVVAKFVKKSVMSQRSIAAAEAARAAQIAEVDALVIT